jgi:tRNA dimethylallyltransferase
MPESRPLASTHNVRPIFLLGPTVVGKSSVALNLAERIGGEIISVDSMQVYRGLDIGTAKPSPTERARVQHHLIDIVELAEPFDAARFASLAHKAVAEIQSRGRVPILCGGTGLYFKAFLEGLGESPPADPELRAELETAPLADLLRELEQRDPVTFKNIDRKNLRRVVRAVEVIRLTGKPFSAQRAEWNVGGTSSISPQNARVNVELVPPQMFGLTRSSADLRSRINARVDKMFADGLVEETRRLLAHGLEQNKTAMQAIGYRQVVEHLRGERSLPETIELVKIKTRQFAKRQMTWFRKQASIKWIELKPEDSPASVAALVKAKAAE